MSAPDQDVKIDRSREATRNVRIHPTHKRYTSLVIGLLGFPVVLASIATVLGVVSANWLLLVFGVCALLALPWILWWNLLCRCPQCGHWLRVDRSQGRAPGGAQLFRCARCDILWDDGMQRGAG